jgi:serine/threonine protein kinase
LSVNIIGLHQVGIAHVATGKTAMGVARQPADIGATLSSFFSFSKKTSLSNYLQTKNHEEHRQFLDTFLNYQLMLYFSQITEFQPQSDPTWPAFSDTWLFRTKPTKSKGSINNNPILINKPSINSKRSANAPISSLQDFRQSEELKNWLSSAQVLLAQVKIQDKATEESFGWLNTIFESQEPEVIIDKCMQALFKTNPDSAKTASRNLMEYYLQTLRTDSQPSKTILGYSNYKTSKYIVVTSPSGSGFYRVYENKILGFGNSAWVFAGFDILHNRPVALKLLTGVKNGIATETNVQHMDDQDRVRLNLRPEDSPHFLKYFDIWSKTWGRHNTQNVQFYRYSKFEDLQWVIAMEQMQGSFDKNLTKQSVENISLDQIVKASNVMVRGILELQQIGILHNDVKFQNLFVNAKGEMVLGDLESMIVLNDPEAIQRVFTSSYLNETPNFTVYLTAPEKMALYADFNSGHAYKSNIELSAYSDLYSLGATIIFELSDLLNETGRMENYRKNLHFVMKQMYSVNYGEKKQSEYSSYYEFYLTKAKDFRAKIMTNNIPALKEKLKLIDPEFETLIDFALTLMIPEPELRPEKIEVFLAEHQNSRIFKDSNSFDQILNLAKNLERIQNKEPKTTWLKSEILIGERCSELEF